MKNISKRISVMLLVVCMLVGLILPAAAAPITTPATGYTSAEDVRYDTSSEGYIANWGARGEVATFISSMAATYYASGYTYEDLIKLSGSSDNTADGTALFEALHTLAVTQQKTVPGYQDLRDWFKYTDCVGGDTTKLSTFYSGELVNSTWDGGTTYNREHTWPDSKCLVKDSKANDAADPFQIRPEKQSVNSGRGNKAYGESSDYHDPGESVRGDVARIVLYMYVRWENEGKLWGTDGVMESLDVLLKWHEADPVDTWEMGRNDAVQSITGARNMFVDYPELAYYLFDKAVPANMPTPSNSVYNHNCTGVVTPPTCTTQGYTTYTCTDAGCTYSYVGDYTAIVAHSYTDGVCSVCGETEPTDYVLVTDLSQLTIGGKIVIVAANANYALSTEQKSNNRGQAKVTKDTDNNTITFGSDVQVITLEAGKTTGTYAFNVGSGYLYASSSGSNHLKTETTLSANSSWSITITSAGVATVKATGSNTRNWMRYNTTSGLFACYSSGQADICIYALTSGDSGDEEVHEHTYDDGVVTAPTCTEQGYTTYTCTDPDCGNSYVEGYKPATGHTYVNGTCACGATEPVGGYYLVTDLAEVTAGGEFVIVVVVNGAYKALPTAIAAKMEPVDVTVSNDMVIGENLPVWTIEAYNGGVALSANGKYLKYASSTNLGSNGATKYKWTVTAKDSGFVFNSATSGRGLVYRAKTFNLFGGYATSNVTATGTEYFNVLKVYKYKAGTTHTCTYTEEITTPATCAAPGVKTFTCTCGDTYTEEIAALGHSYGSAVTAPDCENAGYTTYTCANCGDAYVADEVPALGHAWADATCTDPKTCGTCGATEGEALGHSYVSEVTAPTCTEGGYTTYTCSACGDSYVADEVAALGHTMSEATCTAPKTCSVCGATEGEALGHEAYTYSFANNTHSFKCTKCGETVTKTATDGKKFAINSAAPILSDDIVLKYRCTIPAGFEYPYIVFEFNGEEYYVSEYEVESDGRYSFKFPYVLPQKMADNICATLYAEVNGTQVSVQIAKYSMLQYCFNTLKKPTASKIDRTLYSDVLAYGAAVQVAMNYKTDALVTDLAAAMLAKLDNDQLVMTPSTFPGLDDSYNLQKREGDATFTGAVPTSATIVLGAKVKLRISITCTDLEAYSYKLTLNGREYSYTGADLTPVNDGSDGKYYLYFEGIKAMELCEVMTMTIWEGDTQVGYTLEYSVGTYIYKNVDKANTSEANRNLMKALFNYGESTKAAYYA